MNWINDKQMNMKTNIKSLVLAAFAALTLSGCSNEDNNFSKEAGEECRPVKFEMNVGGKTKTVTDDVTRKTTWEEGDAVGIFAYAKGTADVPVFANSKYVLAAGKWEPAGENDVIYADKDYDFYAYYPYQEGVTDPSAIALSVSGNQTGGCDASDVLAARAQGVAGEPSVTMVYNHMFSLVEVKVQGDKVIQEAQKVLLKNVALNATLDLLGGAQPAAVADGNAAKSDVTMYYVAPQGGVVPTAYTYRAMVPAQTVAAQTELVKVVDATGDGKSYKMKYNADVPYHAGRCRQITVEINDRIDVIINETDFDILPWEQDDRVPGEGGGEEEGGDETPLPGVPFAINDFFLERKVDTW